MHIKNNAELSKWMNERMRLGRDMRSIKGPPPPGSTYSDGEPIIHPVNVAWEDTATGEIFIIER